MLFGFTRLELSGVVSLKDYGERIGFKAFCLSLMTETDQCWS